MSTPRSTEHSSRLDALDEKILWELTKDARIKNAELAAKLHVAPSTTLTRMKALKAAGIWIGSHARVNVKALGLSVQAIVAVRIRLQARPNMVEYAKKVALFPSVSNVFFIGGTDDFFIHVICPSTDYLRDFVSISLSGDPAVASTQTYIVFEHLMGLDFLPHVSGLDEVRRPIR